jgi:UTP--glucose-1-phosphate uridylyltransferase
VTSPVDFSPLRSLHSTERALLDGLGLDAPAFEMLAGLLHMGCLPGNRIAVPVEPPPPGLIRPPAPAGSREGDALVDAGQQLLHQGRAAMVVLNGGMATRFGGRVKGVVDALPGRSFLALQASRLASWRRKVGRSAPLLVMNSRATDEATREHLAAGDHFGLAADDVFCFMQSGAPRLNPDGTLFRDELGEISIYGPGHGDLMPSLRRSGALDWARARGIEYLLMANVDNLGAALDPRLLGAFAATGAEMMVEVVAKDPGDKGGAPASVNGRVQLVEDFAFPEGFDKDSIPVFNTNTLWFRVDAIDRDLDLRWYCVHKEAGGRPVVQFERLVGQVSWSLETAWTLVTRDRFLPVKSPEDLDAVRPRLREMFGRLKLA